MSGYAAFVSQFALSDGNHSVMKRIFNKEVDKAFRKQKPQDINVLKESDILHLPVIVQKYLINSGVVGREKLWNAKITMLGKMRGKENDPWMKIKSVQYNFFDPYSRFFYIKAYKMGIPATGLHVYKDESATMRIKLAGFITIADAKGPEMDQGETVTVLNDMFFMAPAALVTKNIKWEIIDPYTVKAIFTNGGQKVSALVYFDENGLIKNFISNDRFETIDGKEYRNYPWSTPVDEYKEMNGCKVPSVAKAIYHHPEGEFCYAEFIIESIEYNT